jgi:hypothetical protein
MDRQKKQKNRDESAISILKKTHKKAEHFLNEYCDNLESELDYTAIPIQKLVRIQVESGLIVADYIREHL